VAAFARASARVSFHVSCADADTTGFTTATSQPVSVRIFSSESFDRRAPSQRSIGGGFRIGTPSAVTRSIHAKNSSARR
jgi:hypothetical protein